MHRYTCTHNLTRRLQEKVAPHNNHRALEVGSRPEHVEESPFFSLITNDDKDGFEFGGRLFRAELALPESSKGGDCVLITIIHGKPAW